MSGHRPSPVGPTLPVRFGVEKGGRIYEIGSWDDRRNLLDGLDIGDRFQVLEAILHAIEGPLVDPASRNQRQDVFVLWAALELFAVLRHRAGAQWGHGPLGMADGGTARRRTPIPRNAVSRSGRNPPKRRAKFYLKNALNTHFIDPASRSLNLPIEIRKLHRKYEQAYFDSTLSVDGARLRTAVLESLHHGTGLQANSPAGEWEARLRAKRGIRPAGFAGTFTHMTIANLLGYYAIGTVEKHQFTQNYRISPWRLRYLVEQIVVHPDGFLYATPWLRKQMRNGQSHVSSSAPGAPP